LGGQLQVTIQLVCVCVLVASQAEIRKEPADEPQGPGQPWNKVAGTQGIAGRRRPPSQRTPPKRPEGRGVVRPRATALSRQRRRLPGTGRRRGGEAAHEWVPGNRQGRRQRASPSPCPASGILAVLPRPSSLGLGALARVARPPSGGDANMSQPHETPPDHEYLSLDRGGETPNPLSTGGKGAGGQPSPLKGKSKAKASDPDVAVGETKAKCRAKTSGTPFPPS